MTEDFAARMRKRRGEIDPPWWKTRIKYLTQQIIEGEVSGRMSRETLQVMVDEVMRLRERFDNSPVVIDMKTTRHA